MDLGRLGLPMDHALRRSAIELRKVIVVEVRGRGGTMHDAFTVQRCFIN